MHRLEECGKMCIWKFGNCDSNECGNRTSENTSLDVDPLQWSVIPQQRSTGELYFTFWFVSGTGNHITLMTTAIFSSGLYGAIKRIV